MNNTITWINPDNKLPPSTMMNMSNHSDGLNHYHEQPPTVSPSSFEYNDDDDDNNSPGITVLFFIFAIFILTMVCYMARSHEQRRRREQEELTRQERLNALEDVKAQEQLRTQCIQHLTRKQLTMTLTSSDFCSDGDMSKEWDIDNKGVTIVGESDGEDESMSELIDAVDGGSVKNREQNNTEPVPNNNVKLRLVSELQDDETDLQDNGNFPNDLENGKENMADGSETSSKTTSIMGYVSNASPQKKQENGCRSSTRTSLQSEMYVVRKMGNDTDNPVLIRNVCAICLDCYKQGDTIAWSGNKACPHAFHQECILDYLVQKKNQEAPCPCCRQVFLPKDRWIKATKVPPKKTNDEQSVDHSSNHNHATTTTTDQTTTITTTR